MYSQFGFLSHFIGILQLFGLYLIDSNNRFTFFPGSITFKRVMYSNILSKKDDDTEEMCDEIKDWAVSHITKTHISHHWWYDKLPDNIRTRFEALSDVKRLRHMFSQVFNTDYYVIEPVHEMNEIYVTGDERKDEPMQSDRVFFISHIDGPFMWMPFVSVYRCLIGVNDNKRITTHFPLIETKHKIRKGDVLGFDFNREIHYISASSEPSEEPRVTLKAHYCIYPKWIYPVGKLMHIFNAKYNQLFRHLFLKTIQPETWIDQFNGFSVVASTHIFVWLETFIGYRNIYFISYVWWMYYTKQIDHSLMTILLYIPPVYKYASVLFVSNHLKSVEKWNTTRDIILFYLIALSSMFYYRVFV